MDVWYDAILQDLSEVVDDAEVSPEPEATTDEEDGG